jgi:predicted transcriptional regulator of viral defense system
MKRTALTTAQRDILEELIAVHGLIVSTQDVIQKLSFETEESKYRFVSQLEQAGWLVRIKQGLYQIADVSSLGTLTLTRYTIAQLLLPESYVSFHAALQQHGLFDQSLTTIESVSLKQKAAVAVQGTVYRFVRTKTQSYFGFSSHAFNGRQVQIADPEKALIDPIQFHRTSAIVDLVL